MEEDDIMKKIENQVNKKSPGSKKKCKPKKKENNYKLFQRLMVEDLIKNGYIK